MSEVSDEEIKAHVLFKLHWKKYWGGRHTALESVKKGIPKHLGGKYINAAKELIKEGLLLGKPTAYGLQISLNPKQRDKIIGIAKKFARE
jgi:hypothetical protein